MPPLRRFGDGNSFIAKISAPLAAPPSPVARAPVTPAHHPGTSTHVVPPRPQV
ncbi:MAG: hypothetical protein ABI968_10025 [Acidobacteriota bacterium]